MSLYEAISTSYDFEDDYYGIRRSIIKEYPDDIINKVRDIVACDCSLGLNYPIPQMIIYKRWLTISVEFYYSKNISIKKDGESRLINSKKLELCIFNDNDEIFQIIQSKHYPFTIKDYYKKKDYFVSLKDFFKVIMDYYSSKSFFAKDVLNTIKQDNVFLLPLTFGDLLSYHNPAEFFNKKYKSSQKINFNWNKHSLNHSYLIIKSFNKVRKIDQKLLLNRNSLPKSFIEDIGSFKAKELEKAFIASMIYENLDLSKTKISQGVIKHFAIDYVNLCCLVKGKIRISFISVNKLVEEHDRLSKLNASKKTPKVEISKNSKFLRLRRILPDEFEWIKSRRRLIEESVMQNHCVWSYANKINDDISQIYSYVDEKGNRFTLEFMYKNNKYYLVQIQGKHNKGDTSKVSELVKATLLKAQK